MYWNESKKNLLGLKYESHFEKEELFRRNQKLGYLDFPRELFFKKFLLCHFFGLKVQQSILLFLHLDKAE